jgi:hypothetical protein
VPRFGNFLGAFDSPPAFALQGGQYKYVGTNTVVNPSITDGGRFYLGDTCQVGGSLYSLDTFIPFTSQWYRWNVRAAAADRSCERQVRQLDNRQITVFKQTSVPAQEELLALDPSRSSLSSFSAIISFVKYTTDWDMFATVIVGGATQGSTQYPGTNCHVSAGVQVLFRFLAGTSFATLATSTVTPSYTVQQRRGVLPWTNVPGCKAWVSAPYYTTASADSPFAQLQPWWNYDLSAQPVVYNSSTGGGVFTSASNQASFGQSLVFQTSAFSRTSSQALRWNEYAGGGSPLWRKSWSFSQDMVNINQSNPCSWTFSGSSSASDRQYSLTDPGNIQSAAVVFS